MELSLKSRAFKDGESLPEKYTGAGMNVSPPLFWHGAPAGTRGFALIMSHPDATEWGTTHWTLYDLPAEIRYLPEGVGKTARLANGAKQGVNDFGQVGYSGPPRPAGGLYRCVFALRAVDTPWLGLPPRVNSAPLRRAMSGHVLAEAKLVAVGRSDDARDALGQQRNGFRAASSKRGGRMAFVLDDLLLSPLTLTRWIGEKIHQVVTRELTDESKVQEELLELQLLYELDEITAEEYQQREAELLQRLEAMRESNEL